MSEQGEDRDITQEEACSLTGWSVSSFRRHARDQRMRPSVIGRGPGGKHLYRRSEVLALRDRVAGRAYIRPVPDEEVPADLTGQVSSHDRALTIHMTEDERATILQILVAKDAVITAKDEMIDVLRREIETVEAKTARELAARDAALDEVRGAHGELTAELRRRTELAEGETVRLAQLAKEQHQARKDAAAALTDAQHRAEKAEALAKQSEETAKHYEGEAARLGRLAEERKEAVDLLVDTQVEAMSQPRRPWWQFWG
jgi:hypothetical protein